MRNAWGYRTYGIPGTAGFKALAHGPSGDMTILQATGSEPTTFQTWAQIHELHTTTHDNLVLSISIHIQRGCPATASCHQAESPLWVGMLCQFRVCLYCASSSYILRFSKLPPQPIPQQFLAWSYMHLWVGHRHV